MQTLLISFITAVLGYVLAISQHGRENIMQSRLVILEALFELETALSEAYSAGKFPPELQVKINRCGLYISCLCASMPLHFIRRRKIRRAWQDVIGAINENKPISAGYTLSAVSNQKSTIVIQAVEKLICAVAGKF